MEPGFNFFLWIELWNRAVTNLVVVSMSRACVLVLTLLSVGCRAHTGPAVSATPIPMPPRTIPRPTYALRDLAGIWKVDLSMPPAKFRTELMADGTYKGNNRTGKWRIEGNQVVLKSFNGGTDYTMRITDN